MSTVQSGRCTTIAWILLLGAAFGAIIVPWSALAAPLDGETCQRLNVQRQGLEARGVRQLVAMTPQHAKAQLSADQIANIRLLMEVDGHLRFRCPMDGSIAALKEDPPEEQPDGSTEPGQAAGTKGSPVKAKQQPAAVVPKPTKTQLRAAKSEVADPAAEPKNSTPAPPDGARAKPQRTPAAVKKATSKADDAFRAPPSGDPNVTPLDKQVPSDARAR